MSAQSSTETALAVQPAPRKIKFFVMSSETCPTCEGNGHPNNKAREAGFSNCPDCGGTGMLGSKVELSEALAALGVVMIGGDGDAK